MSAPADTVRPARRPWQRNDIQGLRAIAVLLVVVYHSGVPVPGGFVGVDVFFVISGFVITQLILRNHASPQGFRLRTFYARRMKRLLPALALMVTVALLLAIFLESPFGPQRVTAVTGLGASFFIANFVIYANTGGYFDAPAAANPLLHTWSLSVEEQFYFVFPSLMAFAWWRANRHHGNGRRIAATLLGLFALASFVLSLGMSLDAFTLPGIGNPTSWAYYSSLTRGWEFAVGALLAMGLAHWPDRISHARGEVLTILGAALIVASAFLITEQLPFPGVVALAPALGTALVMAGGTMSTTSDRLPAVTRALGLPGLVWIGALSYSWYLWHWPIIVFAKGLWPASPTLQLALGVGSLLPAWVAYRFVENPLRENPRITGRRIIRLIAVVIAVPSFVAVTVIVGANHSWGIPAIRSMADQITPLPVSFTNGCDNGAPLGQQQGLNCTWNATAPGPAVYLVGDSEAGQLSEAVIGAGRALDRPVTIADFNSCPFIMTTPAEPPLSTPECQAFVQESADWLSTQAPGTVVIGMSPNYVNAEFAGALTNALERSVAQLRAAGHDVVLLDAIPQFPDWGPHQCSTLDAMIDVDRCGDQVSRTVMDDRQVLAMRLFADVAAATGARLFDQRDTLCSAQACATNSADQWRYRDSFHITVGESARWIEPMTKTLEDSGQALVPTA